MNQTLKNRTLCVAGASGLVGANITKAALARGYSVNGTMRDHSDVGKSGHLEKLPGAERLQLFSADMANPGSMEAAMTGVDAVFIACLIPTYFAPDGTPARELDDERGVREIVRPTVDGCLNIMASAAEAGIKNVVICSSTSSTNPIPPVPIKTEAHWSDEYEQYRAKKYTSAAKTVMEKAAFEFAQQQGLRLCVLLPTLMLGPAVLPSHNDAGFQGLLNRLVKGGTPRHEQVPDDSMSMIHLDDLAALFLAAYENPSATGRYFGVHSSWHWQDIYDELARLIPGMQAPAPCPGGKSPPTRFDPTRRDSLGVSVRDIPEILSDTISWIRRH